MVGWCLHRVSHRAMKLARSRSRRAQSQRRACDRAKWTEKRGGRLAGRRQMARARAFGVLRFGCAGLGWDAWLARTCMLLCAMRLAHRVPNRLQIRGFGVARGWLEGAPVAWHADASRWTRRDRRIAWWRRSRRSCAAFVLCLTVHVIISRTGTDRQEICGNLLILPACGAKLREGRCPIEACRHVSPDQWVRHKQDACHVGPDRHTYMRTRNMTCAYEMCV